jgi:hypothetical protein
MRRSSRCIRAITPPSRDAVRATARSRSERNRVCTEADCAGVRIFFYLEDRERTITSPTDKLLVSVSTFADEMERERSRQRTYDALARKVQTGYVAGGRCFGYRNVRELSGAQHQLHGQRIRTRLPIAYEGPKRAKATYLLTGLLKCGMCGAGMEVRRQKHGRVRVTIVHCSAHWRKGKNICRNSRTAIMADVEVAVLASIQHTLLDPDVIEEAIRRAAARLACDDGSADKHAARSGNWKLS